MPVAERDLFVQSIPVSDAGSFGFLEASTIRSYQEHVDLHLVPLIGLKKLSVLTMPGVSDFADRLREAGRSPEMVRRVVRSLGAIFREARRRGLAATDPTAGLET